MLGLSELSITATAPEVTKRLTNNPASRATCMQSNIATSLFRLVVEGKHDTISFYLVPTENNWSLNEVSLRYSPLSIWKAQFGPRGQVVWELPTGILLEEMLDVTCLDLIRHLIDATLDAGTLGAQNQAVSGFSAVDPRLPGRAEHTAKHTSSLDGTHLDSVPSPAGLQSGIFETTRVDIETTSTKSLFEQEQSSERVVESHELAKLEPTWQPVYREQTDVGKPKFPAQQEQQAQIVPEAAKQADFGKPNFPWQSEQQDNSAPKTAKQADFGKPNFPWQSEQQDNSASKVAKQTDFGKPDFPWQREMRDQSASQVPRQADFGKPDFPWQRERRDEIAPEIAKQTEIVAEPALARDNLVEPKFTSQQDGNISETAVESAEREVERVSSLDLTNKNNADVEEKNTSEKGVTTKRFSRRTNTRRNRKKRSEKFKKNKK
ncbi:MAG: hypothetical protein K2X93_19300 [Candidatus Obscuribacterales bacterium]|nr:hypothetical protein [Candidatus Obscuribacterales bacterium]